VTSNTLEELRQQLLRDYSVQEMIRVRAYEIFVMRGVQPGGPAQDWFQAENEVLAFLLANQPPEQPTGDEVEVPGAPSVADASREPQTPEKKRKPRSVSKEPAKKPTTRRTGAKKSTPKESKPRRPRRKSNPEDKTGQ
jgi:hypothetical protein